ncbi:(2Fe-2S)-binding protein [Corynebacterium glutamicum]|uniref:(2Fe-2S)-binding protein n=1 Tax=Corynebacterium glutamicum TaxID=1718 RepID=UPI000945AEDF|nr:(2Fe-2S)-binding protein [Corynebacterium glutamicum]
MNSRYISFNEDPIQRTKSKTISITFDRRKINGEQGQTIAGLLMSNGISTWRTTSKNARPRGLFCGIGICFDCIVTVNGQRDVRACQRRCQDGDIITVQHDKLPEVKSHEDEAE